MECKTCSKKWGTSIKMKLQGSRNGKKRFVCPMCHTAKYGDNVTARKK